MFARVCELVAHPGSALRHRHMMRAKNDQMARPDVDFNRISGWRLPKRIRRTQFQIGFIGIRAINSLVPGSMGSTRYRECIRESSGGQHFRLVVSRENISGTKFEYGGFRRFSSVVPFVRESIATSETLIRSSLFTTIHTQARNWNRFDTIEAARTSGPAA